MSEPDKFYYFETEQDARSWRGLERHVWWLMEREQPQYLISRKDEVAVQEDIRYSDEQEPGKPYRIHHLRLSFCQICHHECRHEHLGTIVCFDKCGKTWVVAQGAFYSAMGMYWTPPPIYMCCGGDYGQHRTYCAHYKKPKAEEYNPWRE